MFCRTATFLTALSLAVGSANAYSNLTSADELEIQAIEAHFSREPARLWINQPPGRD
jgi:hypothetical protein